MKAELKDHLTSHLITISKDATAAEAQLLMTNNCIRHIPVMDTEKDVIVGILSDRDLLRSPNAHKPVFELMSSPFKTFDVSTSAKIVVQSMIDEKVSSFLVTKDKTVVGIVTTEDMLLLLSQLLDDETNSRWIMSEFLVNPLFQNGMNMISQSGI